MLNPRRTYELRNYRLRQYRAGLGQGLFARKGIAVSVATTRDPETFASAAAAIGPTIIPKQLAEAVKADIVFLAVRFESHKDVAKALPNWKGKTIVDVTNAYGVPLEQLGGHRRRACA